MRRSGSVVKRWLIFLSLIIFILISSGNLIAQLDQYGNLRLGNEYIEIVVNGNEENMGRFAVDITGGNPVSPGDDGEPLIYGRPRPWTSYSTIFIDNENYVFGGKTEQRAGRGAKYGMITTPPTIIQEGKQLAIKTVTQFDIIEVEQILTFSKSSTTGLYDTVLIKYRFTNLDQVKHKVGLRIMLDTMLGENDGAPFRVGEKAVTTDTYFMKGSLPEFWQAFDALSNPKVTAQGTIKGPDVSLPDKVYFADWGSMADGLWKFKFEPGEEFWREGEFELDSAIALYWAPLFLEPGDTQTFVAKYGLGGITVVPGLLSLGVTSPAEVTFDTQTRSFPVIAYIENTSEIIAKDVIAKIKLSDAFAVVSGGKERLIGNLEPGKTSQIAWEIEPIPGQEIPDLITYKVMVEASNTDSNQVERQVKFTPPPFLKINLEYPDSLVALDESLDPNPFDLLVHLQNNGGSTAYEVKTQVILPPGLEFAEKEKMSKYIGALEPGEEYVIPWKIKVLDNITGNLAFEVDLYSLNSPKSMMIGNLFIPELSSKIYLLPLKEEVKVGDFFGIQLRAANIEDLQKMNLNLIYDPAFAKAMYNSRGTLFIKDGEKLPWSEGTINRSQGLISNISGDLTLSSKKSGIVSEVYFKALQAGILEIRFAEVLITDSNGDLITLEVESLTIEIKE